MAASSVDYDFETGMFRIGMTGVLDLLGAAELRELVHIALAEHPLAVIVDLERITHVVGISTQVVPSLTRHPDPAPILVCASAASECGKAIRGGQFPQMEIFETEVAALAALAASQAPRRERMHLHLAGDDSAPLNARRLVDKACARWHLDELCPQAEVIISELVSNAVRHAKSDIELTVAKGQHYLHLHVRDRSRRLPTLPPAARGLPEDPRGIRLVDRLSHGWGTTLTSYGKTVWATIALPEPPASRSGFGVSAVRLR